MRKTSLLLCLSAAGLVALSAGQKKAAKPAAKPKTAPIYDQAENQPWFVTTPTVFADQFTGKLDSQHFFDQPEEMGILVVKGDTERAVWEAVDAKMNELAPQLQLARMTTVRGDVDGNAIVEDHLAGRKFILFRAKTSPGLINLSNRIDLLANRQDGRTPIVVRQVFVLLDELTTKFGDGEAVVKLRIRVIPMGILGRIPKEHLSTSGLRTYLADWIGGRDLGQFRGEMKF